MMTATEFDVVEAGTARIGRQDVGMGHEHRIVTIAGEPFAVITFTSDPGNPRYCTPCGYCEDGWSGSKSYYGHVMSGVCFQCHGTGIHKRYASEAEAVRVVKRRIADRARRERKEAARIAQQETDRAAWTEANPEVAADLAAIRAEFEGTGSEETYYAAYNAAVDKWGGFLVEVATIAEHRPPSEKQTAAVAEAIARQRGYHAEREAEQARREATQRYYGTVGDKVTGTGTVVVAMSFETQFGYTALRVIEGTGDFEGVTFKIMGSGKTLWECGRGDQVVVSGAVKDHETYEGTAQTVLTRAKITVTEAAESEEQ